MFNPDFYPTPPGVAAEMLEQHRRPKRAGKRQRCLVSAIRWRRRVPARRPAIHKPTIQSKHHEHTTPDHPTAGAGRAMASSSQQRASNAKHRSRWSP